MSRWFALGAVVTLVLLLTADPAVADPARPTNFRSTVTAVTGPGAQEGLVTAVVRGGDAYLEVSVAPGHLLEIPGYDDEPYLRFLAEGTVEVNTRSPARWLNDARFGAAELRVPDTADAQAPPTWEVVARGGRYAWHDHRIHFMSPSLPPDVDPSEGTEQPVFDWEVPLLIDGQPVRIEGALVWVPGPGGAGVLGLITLTLLLTAALMRWAGGPATVAVPVTGAVLLGVGGWTTVASPPGMDADPALLVLPVASLVLWSAVRVVDRGRPGERGRADGWGRAVVREPGGPTEALPGWRSAAAAAPLLGWGLWQSATWWRPVPALAVPVTVARGLVVAALATGLAVLIAGLATTVSASRRP